MRDSAADEPASHVSLGQSPASLAEPPPWQRIFPDADHRWVMGLRSGDLAEFFAPRDPTGAVRAERAQWLAEDVDAYSALTPEAEPALRDTVELAQRLGLLIDVALPPQRQLRLLGEGWEPDFVWMHPDGDGAHRMVGGVVCFPSSWDMREKLGRTMHEIHGPVPGLNAALGQKVETFLSRLEPDVVWTRENYGFSRDASFNHHPSRPIARLDHTVVAEEFFIRLEHQLLMKFTHSGSVLFGIRVEVVSALQLMRDPVATARVSRALFTMSPEAAAYKGIATAQKRLVDLLNSPPG